MNTNESINLDDLRKPFSVDELEWRVVESGKGKDNKIWAKVVCYITNRAIMERLDKVVGQAGWKNCFQATAGGGVICGLAIRIDGEWIEKFDGCDPSEVEPFKGAISGSMKRAAVQWGIARYLYDLEIGWANIHPDGARYARLPEKKGGDAYRWDPPVLPAWAVEGHYETPEEPKAPHAGNGKPGSEIDVTVKAMAAIRNAPTMAKLSTFKAAIVAKTESGEYSADDFKRLEKALTERQRELTPQTDRANA